MKKSILTLDSSASSLSGPYPSKENISFVLFALLQISNNRFRDHYHFVFATFSNTISAFHMVPGIAGQQSEGKILKVAHQTNCDRNENLAAENEPSVGSGVLYRYLCAREP